MADGDGSDGAGGAWGRDGEGAGADAMRAAIPPTGEVGQESGPPPSAGGVREPVVLAVDPGRGKCGVAVCAPGRVLHRSVVPRQALPEVAWQLARQFRVGAVVVGGATGSAEVSRELEALGIPVHLLDEAGTTLAARDRYFQDHPPRGFWRLVPRSLRTPREPYDDYVAVLLAERFLQERTRNGVGLTGVPGAP